MLLGGCKRGEMGLVWTELGVNGRALKENEQKEKGVPFRVAKIGSTRLPAPQSGSDLYRKNDYTQ